MKEELMTRIAFLRIVSVGAALLASPCLVLALMVPGQPPRLPGPPAAKGDSHRVTVTKTWVAAVRQHVPGKTDAALSLQAGWSVDDLRAAWVDVNILIALLRDPAQNRFAVPEDNRFKPVTLARQDQPAMRELAKALIQQPGPDAFLKRAALFHTDLAMLDVPAGPSAAIRSSLLIPKRVVVKGQQTAEESPPAGDVNWEFARILLDGVHEPSRDQFVRDWYRAALTYRLGIEELDMPHFDHGLRIFPDDPEVLYLNGCLHESFADARVQAAIPERKRWRRPTLDVESESAELKQAEDLFRRALDADPAHGDARLRYGRTLGRLGRHTEAAVELRAALDGVSERFLKYFAQLFLGAEEEALGQLDAARAAYEQAAALYQHAQSPLVALSQLAHRRGDFTAAREALEPVLDPAMSGLDEDPWWHYRRVPGRFATRLMADVHATISRAEPQ